MTLHSYGDNYTEYNRFSYFLPPFLNKSYIHTYTLYMYKHMYLSVSVKNKTVNLYTNIDHKN